MQCVYTEVFKNRKWLSHSHVLRGSSGEDVIQILEGKLEATTGQGRPSRMWQDDIKQWTQLNTYEDIKRLAQDRCQWKACTAACQPSDPEDDS